MNDMLLAPFSSDDVHKAVLSIGDLKASDLDGLHAIFSKSIGIFLGLKSRRSEVDSR